ncbi:glycosyl hydrolase [Cohnella sp. GCM10027633]|uniref:glycosyl hydrolase n=1 Tax=unclassified Cohnella TaxID=2636738 RepID=UPI0036326C0B
MKLQRLKEIFDNPPADYRGVPFWSWNDDLKQDELDRQVKGFKDQGMGGFMMHVREGLETPYLGEDFMERIKSTVDTAKKEGVYAWLYDEDRYSSGMGGGEVARMGGDDVRAKVLTLEVVKEIPQGNDPKVVALYEASIRGDEIAWFHRIDFTANQEEIAPNPNQNLYLVFRREFGVANEWCHGDTYTDLLNPRSTELFIQSTYEKYKDAVGDEFGETVPGIFTDEPTIRGGSESLQVNRAWISWTDSLPAYFKDSVGYEIWDVLPYLFFQGEKASKTRFDYWKTITERFSEAYTKQIGDWCRSNGLLFSGHYHSEGSLLGTVQTTGAVMPHYRYMDVPGIDTLCEQTDESLTIKQVASVARQYGMKRVITETYGVTGWDFTFEGRKWLGDWQFVLGVNLLTHHLALYSLKGCRKRDYPPSFNYNTNWWSHNHVMEDYFARLSSVLTQGEVVRDVLVLHPVSSVWSMLGANGMGEYEGHAGRIDELREFESQFNRFIDLMLAAHYDFDLGDELILQESGRVENERLNVNLAAYKVVIMPPMMNVFGSTVELIRKFLDDGGKVIASGTLPDRVDGDMSGAMEGLSRHRGFIHVEDAGEVPSVLEKILTREVSLKNDNRLEAEDFLYMLREVGQSRILFVVNKDRQQGANIEIALNGIGRVEVWDPLTGEVTEAESVEKDGKMIIRQAFGPADSKLYVLVRPDNDERKSARTTKRTLKPKKSNDRIVTALGPVSRFTRTEPNAITLDKCQYRIGEGKWSAEMDVWQAQREIRSALGMRHVFANGGLQRHLWIHDSHQNDGTPISLAFEFEVSEVPCSEVSVAIEQAESFTMIFNGEDVVGGVKGWYLDRSFGTVSLPQLKAGRNRLEVSCAYDHAMELEDCYLIGDFGVSPDRVLVKEPETLRFGDWCLQGYMHYCGSIVYHLAYECLELPGAGSTMILELGDYRAVTIEVKVNGRHAGYVPWAATKQLDIGEWLVIGENSIDIEVVGSPRNLLGPLHQAATSYNWKEWWDYRREGIEYTPDYVVVPYGLMGQVHLKLREDGR